MAIDTIRGKQGKAKPTAMVWNPPRLTQEEMSGLTEEEKQALLAIEQTLVEGEKLQYEDILQRFGRSEKRFTRQFEILRDDWSATRASMERELSASQPESSEQFAKCFSKSMNNVTNYKLKRLLEHFNDKWGPNSGCLLALITLFLVPR